MHERDTIRRLKNGDITAMHVLVTLYSLKALRSAYLITQDRDLADDVVQDAFLRAYERIGSFDTSRSFGPWFLRIVVRGAIDAAQHASKRSVHPAGDVTELLERIPDLGALPEASAEWSEVRQEVWQAIGSLPPKQRAAVVMRYYLDLSEEEMAQALNISHGTVKSRLHTARERLRQMLSSWFVQEVQ